MTFPLLSLGMSRNVLTGLAFIAATAVIALFLFRKDDGLSKVQRDIAESMDRARTLKTQRDSLAKLTERHRFPKQEVKEEVEKAGQTAKLAEEEGGSEIVKTPVPALSLPQGEGASIPQDRFFTTAAMNGLIPQGKQNSFKPGESVYVYAGIHAPQAEKVKIEWIDPSGTLVSPVDYIDVQSNTGPMGYRIYKYRSFKVAGKYEVRLLNSQDKVIGKTIFSIAG